MAQYNRKVPDKATLQRWHNQGLTHQQMADRTPEVTGERVSRGAITAALARYGIVTRTGPRYSDVIPWPVRSQHLRAYPVRMLRVLGRSRAGSPLNPTEARRLEPWLRKLEQADLVVAYDPDSDQGFVYVTREPGDPEDIPIRVQRVWLNPPT